MSWGGTYGSVTSTVAELAVNLAIPYSGGGPVGEHYYDGCVDAVAAQADGRIVLGGLFRTLDGELRHNIGRRNADGTLDRNFHPDANSWVYALAVEADGRILVGGGFTRLDGQWRRHLARLHGDGTPDAAFQAEADGDVYALAVQADGKILVGGLFTNACGVGRSCLARLLADGTLDADFHPGLFGGDPACVNSVAIQADAGPRLRSGGGRNGAHAAGAVRWPHPSRRRLHVAGRAGEKLPRAARGERDARSRFRPGGRGSGLPAPG